MFVDFDRAHDSIRISKNIKTFETVCEYIKIKTKFDHENEEDLKKP